MELRLRPGIFRILVFIAIFANHRDVLVPSFLRYIATNSQGGELQLIVIGRYGNRGSVPGWCRRVFFWGPRSLLFPREKPSGREAEILHPLSAKVQNVRSYIPLAYASSCHISLFSAGTTLINLPFREPQMWNDQM